MRTRSSRRTLIAVVATASLLLGTVVLGYLGLTGGGLAILKIQITDLPPGMVGDVTLSGPAGYRRHLTQSTTIYWLRPGAYRASGREVAIANLNYWPQSAPDSVTLGSIGSETINVGYLTVTPSTTRVLSEAQAATIVAVTPTSLTFDPGTQVESLQIGDVILSGIAPTLPNGTLRKVTNMTRSGTTLVVETRYALLDEAFTRLHLAGSSRLRLLPSAQQSSRSIGAGSGARSFALVRGLASTNLTPDPAACTPVGGESLGEMQPNIAFTLKPELHYQFDILGSVKRFGLKLTAEWTGAVGTTVSGSVLKCELSKQLAEAQFAPVPVGVPPIVLNPFLGTFLSASADFANVNINLSVGFALNLGAGFLWTSDHGVSCWCDRPKFNWTQTFLPGSVTPDVSGLESQIGIGPQYGIRIYEVAGPYIGLDVYGRVSLPTSEVKYEIDAGVEVKVGAKGPMFVQSPPFEFSPPNLTFEQPVMKSVQFLDANQNLAGQYIGHLDLSAQVGKDVGQRIQLINGRPPYGACSLSAQAPTAAVPTWLTVSTRVFTNSTNGDVTGCVISGKPPGAAILRLRLAAHDLVPGWFGETLTDLTLEVYPSGSGPAPSPNATTARYGYVISPFNGVVTPINLTTSTAGVPFQPGNSSSVVDLADIAVTPDRSKAYAVTGGVVVPIDLRSNAPGKPIPVKGDAAAIAIAPDGRTAYVAVFAGGFGYGDFVQPINLANDTLGASIPMDGNPRAIAITPDGRAAYVVVSSIGNTGGAGVVPIDLNTNTPGTPISLDPDPFLGVAIAITPDGNRAYVVLGRGLYGASLTSVVPIDLSTGTADAPIRLGGELGGILITPDGKRAYVTRIDPTGSSTNAVVPIDITKNVAGQLIQYGQGPTGVPGAIAATPDGQTAYATDGEAVVAIDLNTNTRGARIFIGEASVAIAIDS